MSETGLDQTPNRDVIRVREIHDGHSVAWIATAQGFAPVGSQRSAEEAIDALRAAMLRHEPGS